MIFVDSSAWLALADVRDANHSKAISCHRQLARGSMGRLITTDYVWDETLTLLRRHVGFDLARTFYDEVTKGESVQPVWVSPEHFAEARAIFFRYRDKAWSFTDCTSFAVMRALSIEDAFTLDRDFEQAGFRVHP